MDVIEDVSIPKLNEMIGLYRVCMGLSRDGESLLKAAGQLKRLALNSEIFSVKAGLKGRVFQSLSKETNRLSQDITDVIHGLLENVNSISIKAISSANKARLCEKYGQALGKGLKGNNEFSVSQRRSELGHGLVKDLSRIYSDLNKAHFIMRDMARLHVQLPVIATLMKIEANRENSFRDTFSTNANSLLTLNEDLKEAMSGVLDKTKDTLFRLERMETGADL